MADAAEILKGLVAKARAAVDIVTGTWTGWGEAEVALEDLDRFLDEGPETRLDRDAGLVAYLLAERLAEAELARVKAEAA